MCQCGITWINSKGNPTPDNNEAIGLAICYDPRSFGEQGSIPIPICEGHAKQKGKFWKLIPLEGQSLEDAHPLVKADSHFKVIPDKVSEAIKNAFPKDASDILNSLRFSVDHFSFNRWGMYVGVEFDGYIHT